MPSTENTTLHLIQQEIQDVMERERELKKYYNNGFSNINNNINNNNSEPSTEEEKDAVAERRSSTKSDGSEDQQQQPEQQIHIGIQSFGNGNLRPPLLRAKSASVLEEDTEAKPKPNFRRLVSTPSTKGVMQRFLKSRGKMQVIAAHNSKPTNGNTMSAKSAFKSAFSSSSLDSYELPAQIKPGQHVRRGFVSAEKKIQQDIADTYKREAELKTLRQSQGNLAGLDEDELDAPLPSYMGGLRASKSMAHLYNSSENVDDASLMAATSAPSSLKPARSLAQLCDAKDEEVTSSQTLIMRFEQMIIKNLESKRT